MAAKSRSATSATARKTNPSASRTGFAGGTSNGKLMNVGLIGLGHMGAGMAANVLKAGHRVTVFNRTPAKAEALIAQGATLATTIAEASHGDAVVTMLANDEAVEDVVLRRNGVIANLPSGGLHVSSSTISVALSERLTDAHTRKSQRFVAAPVFGRPDVAAAGRLFIVAGGDAAAIKAAASLLDAIGQRTFVISEMPKAANLVKLSGNFLSASVIEALGEALALVGKAGIDKRSISRVSDLHPGRLCRASGAERHSLTAGCRGGSARADAGSQSPTRPFP